MVEAWPGLKTRDMGRGDEIGVCGERGEEPLDWENVYIVIERLS